MARYLIQDHRFLDSFLILLGAALVTADTFEARLRLGRFIGAVSSAENTYFLRAFEALGVTEGRRAADPDTQSTTSFKAIMREAAETRSYAAALSVLVVTEWLYLDWAKAAVGQLCACRMDRPARQSQFSHLRRLPPLGVGPCRPCLRGSVPRLLSSSGRARTFFLRGRLCRSDLTSRSPDPGKSPDDGFFNSWCASRRDPSGNGGKAAPGDRRLRACARRAGCGSATRWTSTRRGSDRRRDVDVLPPRTSEIC